MCDSNTNKMIHNKDIKNLAELKSLLVHKYKKEEYFTMIFHILKIPYNIFKC